MDFDYRDLMARRHNIYKHDLHFQIVTKISLLNAFNGHKMVPIGGCYLYGGSRGRIILTTKQMLGKNIITVLGFKNINYNNCLARHIDIFLMVVFTVNTE